MAAVPSSSLRALLALSLACAFLAPAASAAYRTYGDPVDGTTTDKDVTHFLMLDLAVAEAAAVAWEDADGSNTVSSTEGVYIDTDASGDVSVGDIRIRAAAGSGAKGAPVKSSDADCCGDIALTTALGSFGFVDVYPGGALDGEVGLGDPVFLDLDGSGTVTTADIKVVSAGSSNARPLAAGTVATTSGGASLATVTGSDPDINAAIIALAGSYELRAFDANGNGNVDNSDTVYLDVGQDGGASDRMPGPGDVRLSKPLSGSTLTAGTMPDGDDTDTVHQLLPAAGAALALRDDGNNAGVAENGEGIYLDMDASGTVTADDIRFIASDTTTLSGKQVLPTDGADLGDALIPWPGNGFRFRDLNGNGAFDAADHLYVELDSDGVAEVGDFKLVKGSGASSSGAVGRVTSSATGDLNGALTAVAPTIAFYDVTGGGGYGKGDVAFLDMDGDGLVTPGDVRVSTGSAPFTTFGEAMTDAEAEMEYCFSPSAAHDLSGSTLGFRDDDNDDTADLDEMVFFDRNGDATSDTLDIRLSTVAGGVGSAGSFVASGNADNNKALDAIALTALSWEDANNDGVYSLKGLGTSSDGVYLDLNAAPTDDTVNVRDVRITKAGTGSGAAGSKVSSTGTDVNAGLTPFAGVAFGAIDANGDRLFNTADAVYANLDAADETALGLPDCATPGDVRLSGGGTATSGGGGGGGGGGSDGGTTDGTGTSTATDTSTSTQTDTSTSTSTETATGTSTSTATSTATSTSTQTSAPSPATLNQQLAGSLRVQRDGDSNTLSWADVAGEDGYQVWSHTSPYALLARLPAGSTAYRDEGASAGTVYLVTAVVGGAELTADDVNGGQVPGYSGVPAGEKAPGGGKGFIPALSPLAAAGALIAVALLARRRLR
jgi:hypothetical protein